MKARKKICANLRHLRTTKQIVRSLPGDIVMAKQLPAT